MIRADAVRMRRPWLLIACVLLLGSCAALVQSLPVNTQGSKNDGNSADAKANPLRKPEQVLTVGPSARADDQASESRPEQDGMLNRATQRVMNACKKTWKFVDFCCTASRKEGCKRDTVHKDKADIDRLLEKLDQSGLKFPPSDDEPEKKGKGDDNGGTQRGKDWKQERFHREFKMDPEHVESSVSEKSNKLNVLSEFGDGVSRKNFAPPTEYKERQLPKKPSHDQCDTNTKKVPKPKGDVALKMLPSGGSKIDTSKKLSRQNEKLAFAPLGNDESGAKQMLPILGRNSLQGNVQFPKLVDDQRDKGVSLAHSEERDKGYQTHTNSDLGQDFEWLCAHQGSKDNAEEYNAEEDDVEEDDACRVLRRAVMDEICRDLETENGSQWSFDEIEQVQDDNAGYEHLK